MVQASSDSSGHDNEVGRHSHPIEGPNLGATLPSWGVRRLSASSAWLPNEDCRCDVCFPDRALSRLSAETSAIPSVKSRGERLLSGIAEFQLNDLQGSIPAIHAGRLQAYDFDHLPCLARRRSGAGKQFAVENAKSCCFSEILIDFQTSARYQISLKWLPSKP